MGYTQDSTTTLLLLYSTTTLLLLYNQLGLFLKTLPTNQLTRVMTGFKQTQSDEAKYVLI